MARQNGVQSMTRSRRSMALPSPAPVGRCGAGLLAKRQPRCAREDLVGGEEGRANVNRGGRDPQIVAMGSVMERVTQAAAGESKLGDGPEETVTHWNDRGFAY